MKIGKIAVLIILAIIVLFFLYNRVNDKESLYLNIGGTLIGFLGAFIIYQAGIILDGLRKKEEEAKSTKYIHQLYKVELEMNIEHINWLITNKKLPFFRLKTITRDKLWGELAGYSNNLSLMQKLNYIYGEFELINNKIDLANTARMANIEKANVNKSTELDKEANNQIGGSILLGQKVIPHIQDSLNILNKVIEGGSMVAHRKGGMSKLRWVKHRSTKKTS
jgi:ABC-type nickel/cobalt efflux system permease component RcnA